MTPRRIAIIASFRIFPAETGGHLRTAVIARSLARLGHEVRIFSLAGRRPDYRDRPGDVRIDAIEPRLTEEVYLGLGLGVAQAATRVLRTARAWVPLVLGSGWVPRPLRDTLDWAEVCISDQPYCVPVRAGVAKGKPWLLISHNLEHRLLERGGWRERLFAPLLRRIEAAVPSRYQAVLTCADDDRDYFARHDPAGRCRLVPVGCAVDPAAYVAPPGARERLRAELGIADDETVFLFSGSRFQPNVDALQWLREFNARQPTFLTDRRLRVLVVGTVSADAWRQGGVIATGRVPEMTPYFAAADAGLNPVTWGSGANVKLFEYLAARLPVMSTPFGVRGIELEPGRDYHPFEPETFAAEIDAWCATRDRDGWRAHAQDVWLRHQASVDIQQVVGGAIGQLPALAG